MYFKNSAISLAVFIAAMCSYLYELLLAHAATALIGGLYLHYVLTFSVYILALGLGSYLPVRAHSASTVLILVELALTIVGGASVYLLYFLDAYGLSLEQIQICHLLLCFVIGVFSGFELPLLYQSFQNQKNSQAEITPTLLSADYLGMFCASILFATILLNFIGTKNSALLVGAINFLLCLWLIFQQRRVRNE